MRRQVSNYKSFRSDQLKQEKARLDSNYKQFESKKDKDIISKKKELGEKLEQTQDEPEKSQADAKFSYRWKKFRLAEFSLPYLTTYS